jgi:hypothetical protein
MDLSQLLQQQLQQQLSGGLMDVLTQQTGSDPQTTTKASSAILSSLMGALARNASTPDGASSLANALDRDHDGSILDIIGGLMQGGKQAPGPNVPTGGGLMDLITGMAQGGQSSSGGGALGGLLGGLLGGGQKKQQGGGGALGDLLGGMLGQAQGGSSGGGLGDLLGGMMRQTQGSDGGGLGDLLGGLLGGKQVGSQDHIPPQFRKTMDGGGILDHVLGTQKEDVAKQVSENSGLSMSKVLPLMATLAPILMGILGKTKRDTGMDAGGLGGALMDMVTKGQSNPRQTAPDLGLAGALLDRDGDGSVMDDVLGMGAKMLGGYLSK